MEKLNQKLAVAEKVLETLNTILKEEYSMIVRDAAIQRFEYSFEAVWKAIKIYLKEREGVVANSPKAVFREALGIGLIKEEEAQGALKMVDDRNLTTHTYIEEVAGQIFKKIPEYYSLMKHIVDQAKFK